MAEQPDPVEREGVASAGASRVGSDIATPEPVTPLLRDRSFLGMMVTQFLGAFNDLMLDEQANATAAEFVRNKVRAIVKDPATAETAIGDLSDLFRAALGSESSDACRTPG